MKRSDAAEYQLVVHRVARSFSHESGYPHSHLLMSAIPCARHSQPKPANERVSESDAVLITYGDSIREETKAPLKTLDEVITKHAGDVLSGIHILPHYPWTSDDGFSVVDYKAVDPALGTYCDQGA